MAAVAGYAGYYFNRADATSKLATTAAQKLFQVSLQSLDGNPQTLSQFRGKVLVVNFWATWCAPCREEIPALNKVRGKYVANGVEIVGIALDNAPKVKQYAEEMGIGYPLLIGAIDTMTIGKDLGNQAGVLPFTVVFDRLGKVVYSHAGAMTESRLGAVVQPLL